MICCKIISDYSSKNININELFNTLCKYGDILWENNTLFFADTKHSVTEYKLSKFLKKQGLTKFYIDIYTRDNQPSESEYINGWITDKLIKINYNQCEKENQKVFRDISIGLDILDREIDRLKQTAAVVEEEKTDGRRES